jgi:excisionase family DNA binding protein
MIDNTLEQPILMTPQQVARMLHIHTATLRRYREEEGLPFYRLGGPNGKVRYKLSEVQEWMEKRRS